MANYEYTPFCLEHHLYPVYTIKKDIVLGKGDETVSMSVFYSHKGEWGEMPKLSVHDGAAYSMPTRLKATWLSVVECQCYQVDAPLESAKAEEFWQNSSFKFYQIGLAPYGGVAVWLCGYEKTVLLAWMKGQQQQQVMIEGHAFRPEDLRNVCNEALSKNEAARSNLINAGLPPLDLFDRWMRQYQYKYVVLEEFFNGTEWQEYDEDDEYYDDIDVQQFWVKRLDGTFDKPKDTSLLRYHTAGIPQCLSMQWHAGNDDYSAFYWIDDEKLSKVFDRYMKLSPNGRMDLLLRIDTRSQHYGLAINGDILDNPITIADDTYQLLVFRNGNEHFKSMNYSQEDGAWNW